MSVRVAVAGMDGSRDLVVLRLLSFSINGQSISEGAFRAKGPILGAISKNVKETRIPVLPF